MTNTASIRFPARKTPPIEAAIYRTLVRPALRRMFGRIAAHGADAPPRDQSTLIYMNHPSWWDGYMSFVLSDEVWRSEAYIMMEEAQLARYGFFRFCGAFGVDRHDPRAGMRSVAYAANLLAAKPGRIVWLFPQGTITPTDLRPLGTFAGAAHIAKRAAPVRCVPLALRYEFGAEQRPEALLRFGPAHVVEGRVDTRALHDEMDQRLAQELDQLRDDWISGATAHYPTILTGRASVNVVWDRVRGKIRSERSRTRH